MAGARGLTRASRSVRPSSRCAFFGRRAVPCFVDPGPGRGFRRAGSGNDGRPRAGIGVPRHEHRRCRVLQAGARALSLLPAYLRAGDGRSRRQGSQDQDRRAWPERDRDSIASAVRRGTRARDHERDAAVECAAGATTRHRYRSEGFDVYVAGRSDRQTASDRRGGDRSFRHEQRQARAGVPTRRRTRPSGDKPARTGGEGVGERSGANADIRRISSDRQPGGAHAQASCRRLDGQARQRRAHVSRADDIRRTAESDGPPDCREHRLDRRWWPAPFGRRRFHIRDRPQLHRALWRRR